ncbi:amino acid ABC transporter permease [Lichenihabitans psoromatis]|uniref:amino acid ABC transporter permease n=1 Tax=Lichenihabitans psoromatis TaxID=2528642 RepID=UPI001FDFF477|nr:amino acid ABC transporter permease [Lichenihabitans psoromatis]
MSRTPRRWAAVTPKSGFGGALTALAVAGFTVAATFSTLFTVRTSLASIGTGGWVFDVILAVLGLASVILMRPAMAGLRAAKRSADIATTDISEARVHSSQARTAAAYAFGFSVAVLIVNLGALFIITNNIAVGKTFFFWPVIRSSFSLILGAFWINVKIFVVAEILVLIWGLIIAIARLTPSAPGLPVRMLAIAYCDVFRGLPAIISIYLIGFGLPLTGLPIVRDLEPTTLAIMALTLTYGAYVAEVYRSGIDSVQLNQTAAARSLGLSHSQTLRFVVVPQAVRRIFPPLLNDFISLQKDTALVNVIGAVDAFNQAKIVAANHFNLSAVTTVAILFVAITIPQARFVDRLIERDQVRTRAGGK